MTWRALSAATWSSLALLHTPATSAPQLHRVAADAARGTGDQHGLAGCSPGCSSSD